LSSLRVRRKARIENSGGKRPFQFVLYDGKWYDGRIILYLLSYAYYMSCITLWV
jgi:hypothetical protein